MAIFAKEIRQDKEWKRRKLEKEEDELYLFRQSAHTDKFKSQGNIIKLINSKKLQDIKSTYKGK